MLTCYESAVRLPIVRSNAQTVLGIAMGGGGDTFSKQILVPNIEEIHSFYLGTWTLWDVHSKETAAFPRRTGNS